MGGLLLIGAAVAQVAAQPEQPPAPLGTTGQPITRGQSTYVDLEAGVGYATNPLLRFGSNTGAAFGRLSAHAVHTRISERTTTVLSAFAQNFFYTNHYGAQQSVELTGRHDARVNEKLRLFGDADLAYDKGGQLDTRINGLPNVPLPPGVVLPPELLPPVGDFLSVTGKQYRASVNVGADYQMSARDSLTLTTGLAHVISKNGPIDTHYTLVPASIGWNRKLTERTTVGARVSAQYADYEGPQSVRTITPQATINTSLSERLTFAGALGVSFSSTDDGITTRHSTGLAADATLCWRGETDNFCGRFNIDQEATTAIGPARTIGIGIDYSKQLDQDQTIQLSAGANRYSNPTSFVTGQTFSRSTYIRAAADYSRRIGGRLFAGADLSARKILQSGPDPKADVTGTVFVRYRLGDVR